MAKIIWTLLFVSFITYSGIVYRDCDPKENNLNETEIPDHSIKNGWMLWQEKNCQSCHQLYGLGGYMGPDLTNVYSAKNKGPEYMRGFIKYGMGRMPDYHLNDEEVADVISFLKWVDQSGQTAVHASSVHWTGTYIINEQKK